MRFTQPDCPFPLLEKSLRSTVYLKRYFQLRPGDRQQLATWQSVIAAARLEEYITDEQDQLIALVKAGLSQYG